MASTKHPAHHACRLLWHNGVYNLRENLHQISKLWILWKKTLLGKVTWCYKSTKLISMGGNSCEIFLAFKHFKLFPSWVATAEWIEKMIRWTKSRIKLTVWNELTKLSSDLHCSCCLQKPVGPYHYLSFLSSLGMLNCPAAAPPVRTKGRMMAPLRNACFTWRSGERSRKAIGNRKGSIWLTFRLWMHMYIYIYICT